MIERSILVVDSHPASLNYLANFLKAKEFKVLEASTGKEGLITAWRDVPDLVLFDPTLADISDREFIQKLRNDPRTSRTLLVALSSDPSPARKQACLNAGVDEYLVKSSQAILSLEEILNQRLRIENPTGLETTEAEKSGSLIIFLSAKGGTGTSSLCANFAMNIQQEQPESSIVVVDLVLPIGSIGPIVGDEGKLNLVTITDLPSRQTNAQYFRANLPKPDLWQFQLLAGSPDPEHGNSIKGARIGEIVDVLCSAYDFVILDIGRSLSRISLPLIQKADLIILVVSTDQSTIKLTKTVWDYLQTQGVRSQKIYAILNRAVGLEGLTKTQAEEIIGLPIKTTIPHLGSNFALANNLNQPITKKYPNDTASIVFKETTADMLKLVRDLRQARSAA